MPHPPPVIHAQNSVSVDSQEIDVESRESNEDFLNYLELIDTFVTAERIPTNKWETPANVTVITSQEIENNHYQTVAEALSHVNGVMITSIGRTDTSGFIGMNGTKRILLLIDGHRVNNTQDTYSGSEGNISELSLIPSIKIVERIEIVKGGQSALYGSDAVGGVVNIVTKKGLRNETEIDVNNGLWNQKNYEITNQGIKGKLSWFVTAGFGQSDKYKHPDSAGMFYTQTDYEDRDLSIRIDDKFSDRNSLSLNYMHRSHDFAEELVKDSSTYWILFQEGSQAWLEKADTPSDPYNLYNSASIEYQFKENTETPGWFRYYNNYKKSYFISNWKYCNYGESKLQGLEYQNGWALGDYHKLIFGLEYHRSDAKNETMGYDDKQTNSASYVQDTISLGNKWTLIPGIRYDHDNLYGGNWSPKFATNYRAGDKTKIYASWGRIYRIPSIGEVKTYHSSTIYDENFNAAGTYLRIGGDYNDLADEIYARSLGLHTEGQSDDIYELKPERGHSETIGIAHEFNEKSSIDFSLFNSQLNNKLFWGVVHMTGNYNLIEIAYNDLVEKRRGLELAFKQNVDDHWNYDFGYSHTHVEDIPMNRVQPINPYYGQHNGYRVGVHYKNGDWMANLLGIMATGINKSYVSSGNYMVLDFNTSYNISERATIYLRALNFTNDFYSNDGDGAPAPGRFLQVGATYKF